MPWEIQEGRSDCSGYAVVKEGGELEGCHGARSDAEEQLRALYAAESEDSDDGDSDDMESMSEYRLFVDHLFAEPQEWIPYLPTPGQFTHPAYGKVVFDRERNSRFVDNFKRGVYQSRLPVDAEHQTKLSGAVGWIVDMRVNENGSADARVEWTDRGVKLLQSNRFRYVSPEFFPKWQDPATEQMHSDIAIGAAITTRPFVKESHLRPLVASETGYFIPEDETPKPVVEGHSNETGVKTMNEAEVQMDETVQLQLTELQTKLSEMAAARVAAEEQALRLSEELQTNRQQLAKMEESARVQRFTELAEGNDPWFGGTATHLKVLQSFSVAFGEESEDFAEYVRLQNAVAEQLKTSQLFTETGHSNDSTTSASDEMDKRAKKVSQEKGITYQQAFAEVVIADPSLYDRYTKGE